MLPAATRKSPFLQPFLPSWPDHARAIVQRPLFEELARRGQFYGNCLNAGCGDGLYIPFLDSLSKVKSITHVDIQLPQNPKWKSERHKLVQASLTDLPFASATFDCAICTEVIEHIDDDNLAISALSRVLKPNSYLLLSVPTPPAPYDPHHVREGYTLAQLSSLLEHHGFRVLESRYCFHITMRLLVEAWQLKEKISHSPRSYIPTLLMSLVGHLDRRFRVGKPWDLIVLAKKA